MHKLIRGTLPGVGTIEPGQVTWKRRKFAHIIRLIDVNGNQCTVRRKGQMQTTSHMIVLKVLLHHEIFGNGKDIQAPTHAWSIDDTGMLDTNVLASSSDINVLEQEIWECNSITIPEEVLQVHGYAPPKNAEGTVPLVYENVNGLSSCLCGNKKVDRMKELHDELEVDMAAYCEHKLHMKYKKNVNGFNQLFKGWEAAIQSITAHNVHKNIGRTQQGGTNLILFGRLTKQSDHNESGKDPTRLGQWTVMMLQGDGVQTQIVCGYNSCSNSKLNSGTSYQQQRRYFITEREDLTCPWKKFHDDLIGQLKKWRYDGNRLVLCIDATENIYRKSIGQSLTSVEGLNMQEVIGEFTGKKIGPIFFRGSKPVDGV